MSPRLSLRSMTTAKLLPHSSAAALWDRHERQPKPIVAGVCRDAGRQPSGAGCGPRRSVQSGRRGDGAQMRTSRHRRWPAVLGVLLVASLPACSQPGGRPQIAEPVKLPPTRIVTIQTADGQRSARVHRPPGVTASAALIVVLHPAAVSALDMETNFGWDTIADRDGVVVAYPDGLLDSFQDTWNGGSCCPPATQLGTDDVGFVDQLATILRTTDGVGSQLYAVGFSNGAVLAYDWACAKPGRLTGIGVVAGALMAACPEPTPTTVVALHGTADTNIPLQGGPGPDGSTFPSVDGSLAPFIAASSCPSEPAVTAAGNARVAVWTCPAGHRVLRAVVDGLDHAWPGAGKSAGTAATPADATGFLWAELRGGS